MTYFSITNHADSSLTELDFHPSEGQDKGFFCPDHKTKTEHRKWAANPLTEHRFISPTEPVNPSKRASLDNPAAKLHGWMADYDMPSDKDALMASLEKVLDGAPSPTWMTKTYSGFLRLVWEFESPIIVPEGASNGFLKEFSKRVKAPKLSPGYDLTCIEATRYYEIGTDWEKIGGTVPHAVLVGCLHRSFVPSASSDITIPFADVQSEVLSRFGERLPTFEVGDRVPLFWVDDGIDRIGAVVKEEGVLAYSDRAENAWNDWASLLGREWVKSYEDRKISGSVENFYSDGKRYWITGNGRVFDENRENFILRLREMGFSPAKKRGKLLSEVEKVLLHVNSNRRIDGVGPFVFRKEKLVDVDGRKLLNTSRNKPVSPAATGDAAKWPWINTFLESLFDEDPVTDDANQRDLFLAWLKRFYSAAHGYKKESGQCLIVSGPTGRGKTLLSKRIVGGLVGGSEDACSYLTGQEKFNANLVASPLWTVDDTSSSSDWRQNRKMTDLIKRSVANPFVESREMYQSPTEVEWNGRLMISLNEDASSLSIVPQQDSSNRDKVIGVRISKDATQDFPPNDELELIIEQELPYFAAWLLEWEPPTSVVGNTRYGIIPWFHPQLRDAARDNSPTQAVMEIIDLFAKLHREDNGDIWTGTAAELMGVMGNYAEIKSRGGSFEHQRLARDLQQACENCRDNPLVRPIHSMPTGGGTIWIINLSEEFDLKAPNE